MSKRLVSETVDYDFRIFNVELGDIKKIELKKKSYVYNYDKNIFIISKPKKIKKNIYIPAFVDIHILGFYPHRLIPSVSYGDTFSISEAHKINLSVGKFYLDNRTIRSNNYSL